MRILQVLNTLGAGGAEQYVAQLSSYLDEQDDSVGVIAGEPFNITDRFPFAVKIIPIQLHPGHRTAVYKYLFSIIRNIYAIYCLIRQDQIQLVHTHLVASALPAWIAAKLRGIPVIHSKMHTQIIASGFERALFRSPLPKLLVKKFLVFSSYAAKEARLIWRVSDEHIIRSSIGVNTDFFATTQMPRQMARIKFSLPDDAFVVSVVARLYPEKDVGLAISGFAAMSDKNSVFLVGGDGPQRMELKQMAQELGVLERVHFLGHQADPRAVYAAADIVMQTTRGPNMGMISLESMSMEVPLLIAARDEQEREMASDTFGGYDAGVVVAANAVAIGAVLDNLSMNRIQLKDKGIQARHYVEAHHSRRRVFADLRTSYRQLVV